MVRINPDLDVAYKIMDSVRKNNGFCPCRVVNSEDTKCMCKEFRDSVLNNDYGFCHCGLFENVKDEKD